MTLLLLHFQRIGRVDIWKRFSNALMDVFYKVEVTISDVDSSHIGQDGFSAKGRCDGTLPAVKNRFPYQPFICKPLMAGRYLIAQEMADIYFEASEVDVYIACEL